MGRAQGRGSGGLRTVPKSRQGAQVWMGCRWGADDAAPRCGHASGCREPEALATSIRVHTPHTCTRTRTPPHTHTHTRSTRTHTCTYAHTHTQAHQTLDLLQTRRPDRPRSSRSHHLNPGSVLYRFSTSMEPHIKIDLFASGPDGKDALGSIPNSSNKSRDAQEFVLALRGGGLQFKSTPLQ